MTSREALDRLLELGNARKLSNAIVVSRWDYEKLLKLTDKDTPLKPNDNLMKGYYHCSKCGREIPECVNKYFMRYCPNCGQKLDWEGL